MRYLLCRLGFHRWGPWNQTGFYMRTDVFRRQILMPERIERECKRCTKTQTRYLKREEAR